ARSLPDLHALDDGDWTRTAAGVGTRSHLCVGTRSEITPPCCPSARATFGRGAPSHPAPVRVLGGAPPQRREAARAPARSRSCRAPTRRAPRSARARSRADAAPARLATRAPGRRGSPPRRPPPCRQRADDLNRLRVGGRLDDAVVGDVL